MNALQLLRGNFHRLGPQPDATFSSRLQDAAVTRLLDLSREAALRCAASTGDSDTLAWLSILSALPDPRRRAIVLHPTFRYWLQGMRRSFRGADPSASIGFASRLCELVWADATLEGLAPPLTSLRTDERGGIRCPSLGRHVELGSSYADCTVQASPMGEVVELRCHDGLVVRIPHDDLAMAHVELPHPSIAANGYELEIFDTLGDGRIHVSNRDSWLRARLSGTNQRKDGVDFHQVDDELYASPLSLDGLTTAMRCICTHWPDVYADIPHFVHVVVPIQAAVAQRITQPGTSERRNFAFTVSSRQGAIYIADASSDETVEMLLHEFAHVKLRQIQLLDPLLEDPLDDSMRVRVPWRDDPRPLPGVLEGLYVFAHVAEYESKRVAGGALSFAPALERRLEGLRFAADCLRSKARLTRVGEEFLEQMGVWVSSMGARLKAMSTQVEG